jgi:hypothetical protein
MAELIKTYDKNDVINGLKKNITYQNMLLKQFMNIYGNNLHLLKD